MQKGFAPILILVGILVIIAVAGGAYYLGRQTTPKLSPNPVVTSQTPQPTPSSSPTDETTDWKVYTSSKNGYSIKYPSTWSLENENTNAGYIQLNSNEKFPSAQNDPEGITYWVTISQILNPNNKAFKDLVTADLPPDLQKSFTYKTDVINSLTVYRTTSLPSRSGCEFVYFKKADESYIELDFCVYNPMKPFVEQERFYKTFNQILSTFKFLP